MISLSPQAGAALKRRNLQPRTLAQGGDAPRGFFYGVQVGAMVWISGQVPKDVRGNLVAQGDVTAQAAQVMQNVKAVVEEAGGSVDDIVKITTYVTSPAFREAVQAVRRDFFRPPNLPASATIVCEMLVPGVLVEVEALAVLGSHLDGEARP
jgi:enamine deaminase RidA (YjgF/YER057c/UK114 family)